MIEPQVYYVLATGDVGVQSFQPRRQGQIICGATDLISFRDLVLPKELNVAVKMIKIEIIAEGNDDQSIRDALDACIKHRTSIA